MKKQQVHLFGGDGIGWALDEDVRTTRTSLEGDVEFVSLEKADVLHCLYYESLRPILGMKLNGKRIICSLQTPPLKYLEDPAMRDAWNQVGLWLARSGQAKRQADEMGLNAFYMPYVLDEKMFFPLPRQDPVLEELRDRWEIPRDKYIIGNFHRDTEGANLARPKVIKGPDVFAAIVYELKRRGLPIHILLAGPRRFWLRNRLTQLGVPYTYIGEDTHGKDDNGINILPREKLNLLYNLLDLYLVTSRGEGGPLTILEAMACNCPVVSRPVGLAEDALRPEWIYDDPVVGVERIESIIQEGCHQAKTGDWREIIIKNYHYTVVRERLLELYAQLDALAKPYVYQTSRRQLTVTVAVKWRRIYQRVLRKLKIDKIYSGQEVSILFKFMKPPWGGGNQFLLGLKKQMLQRGIKVEVNQVSDLIKTYLAESVWFDEALLTKLRASQSDKTRIIHRIDGPIHIIRGTDRDLDDKLIAFNREFVDSTIVQSLYVWRKFREMGYTPVRPVIINNAADPELFFPKNKGRVKPEGKVRLISTSWSNSPRKGAATYKWLDENLDWSRYEYTFVGRINEKFQNIRLVEAVDSAKLAEILRQHDIYITASQNDPCSNSLAEALSCGLPALYLQSGGHPELTGLGGLPFSSTEDILGALDRLAKYYHVYEECNYPAQLKDVTASYLDVLLGTY